MLSDKELHCKLFGIVKDFVWTSGGDGDGFIISETHHEKLADEFEKYEKETDKWFVDRHEQDGVISFVHNQESICFFRDRSPVPFYGSDIVVEITY